MQHQNLFVFDIETVPDVAVAKNLLDLKDDDVAKARQALTD
jgi:predicted PolB exonuclease-like 3'-5' exonuclease